MQKNSLVRKAVFVFVVTGFLFACSIAVQEKPAINDNAGDTSISFNYTFSGVFQQQVANRATESFTGLLTAHNNDTGVDSTYSWYAMIDESAFTIQSTKTIVLMKGNYNLSLILTKGVHSYAGIANGVAIGNGNNNVPITLKPIIGDTGTVIDLTQISSLRFSYSASELSQITEPKIGYISDGQAESIIALNKTTGISETFFNLTPGSHTIRLKLYDGNIQIGESQAEQERVTVVLKQNIIMNIIPLYACMKFNMALNGGNAVFNFAIPKEIVDEVSGLTELKSVFRLAGLINGSKEQEVTFTQGAGNTFTGSVTLAGFRYDTVALTLEFIDRGDNETVANGALDNVVLTKDAESVNMPVQLRRRAVVSGSLLGVLGVNVYYADNTAASGVMVYANGVFKGITGSDDFGTAGFIKMYITAGAYSISAKNTGPTFYGEANVTVNPLGIHNTEITLISTLRNGLAAEYLFNGNADDSSGNGNNGINNGAVLTTDRFGNANSAYRFNWGNYINFGNNSTLTMVNGITVSLWVKVPSLQDMRVMGKYDNDLLGGWRMTIKPNGTVGFGVSSGTGDHDLWSIQQITTNAYYHIVGTYNKVIGELKVYINTIAQTETGYYSGIFSYTAREWPDCLNMELAHYWAYGNSYYNGIIDDVRVYNRALNNSEVQALYHEGSW